MDELDQLRAACTPKEALFAEQYAAGASLVDAASTAGYAGTRKALTGVGRKVADRERVQAYVRALRDASLGNPQSNLERYRDRLETIAMGEPIPQPVGRGGALRMRPATSGVQVKALETLVRMHGGLEPRIRLDIRPAAHAEFERFRRRMSEDAYRELLQAAAALGEDD